MDKRLFMQACEVPKVRVLVSSGSAGSHTGVDPVIQGTGQGMLRGGAKEEAGMGPPFRVLT